jgi:transposase
MRLLRALLLRVLYTVHSERMLMEQLEYKRLFRWFVGLSANEPVWHPTVVAKNRVSWKARWPKRSSR